jgi:hypothetical protein
MTGMTDVPMMAVFIMLCLLLAGVVVAGLIALFKWLFRRRR